MIKFETINETLCRMLEKPVPLTPDSKLPCLVRLIQDDSRMGMFNRDTKPSRLSDVYLAARIVSNNIVVDEFMELNYHRFEIIGYPVTEGSDEWALYQMMQGNKVRHKSYIMPKVHCAMNEKHQIAIFTKPSSMIDGGDVICHADDWLMSRQVDAMVDERNGWQIYKEPEPQYKVGDWVEVECQNKLYHKQVLFVTENRVGFEFSGMTPSVCFDGTPSHIFKFIRKLSPSEVVIHIGCLRGTVERAPYIQNGFNLVSEAGNCFILFNVLDKETRELVGSLLKAQEEKCHS